MACNEPHAFFYDSSGLLLNPHRVDTDAFFAQLCLVDPSVMSLHLVERNPLCNTGMSLRSFGCPKAKYERNYSSCEQAVAWFSMVDKHCRSRERIDRHRWMYMGEGLLKLCARTYRNLLPLLLEDLVTDIPTPACTDRLLSAVSKTH